MSMLGRLDGIKTIHIPPINVEILGQVCSQSGCGGGPSDRFQVEVVHWRFSHVEVFEVEVTRTKVNPSVVPCSAVGIVGPMTKR